MNRTPLLVDAQGNELISDARRRRRDQARDSLRARYDAASHSDILRKHWSAADCLSSREANDPGTRKTLRSRSRYECLEANSFAAGITRTLVNDIIGRGPRLQITDRRLRLDQRQAVERRHRRWWNASRMTPTLRTDLHAEIVSGESFLHSHTNFRQKDEVKLACKSTEADQISSSVTHYDDPTHIDGIEIDQHGHPVRYERLKIHPGDSYASYSKDDVERIDADQMIHMFRCERPGQYRGVPWMVPALPLFALLRRYTIATVLTAESAARFAGVFYTDHPILDGVDPIEPMDEIEIALNSFLTMPEGWKLEQLRAEQPTTVYEMFRNAILTEIARCVSMPKNKALNDSGGYNYASGMLDFQTYFEMVQVERARREIEQLDRVFGWWLDEALLIEGYLPADMGPLPGGIEHVWTWDEFKHVDPTKQANATETLWHLGLVSDSEFLLAKNVDPAEHYERLAEQVEQRKKLGLPLPGGATPQESLQRRAAQDAADARDEREEQEAAA